MDDEYTANMLLCLNENCRRNSFIYSITPNNIVVVTVVLVLGFIQYKYVALLFQLPMC